MYHYIKAKQKLKTNRDIGSGIKDMYMCVCVFVPFLFYFSEGGKWALLIARLGLWLRFKIIILNIMLNF